MQMQVRIALLHATAITVAHLNCQIPSLKSLSSHYSHTQLWPQTVIGKLNIKLQYFEEVFTSQHWMMRIYRWGMFRLFLQPAGPL